MEAATGHGFSSVGQSSGFGFQSNDSDNESNDSSDDVTPDVFSIWKLLSPRFYLTLIWNTIHSATFASVFLILLVWASIFIYITFYFLYIPALDLSRSIHFQFHSDCDPYLRNEHTGKTRCDSPAATVQLGQYKTPTLFAKGQQYRIRVDLNLPDSEVNLKQGMFMINLNLLDSNHKNIASASRPAIMTYKSLPVKLLHTFFALPLYVLGVKRESEDLYIPLIEDYVDGTRPGHGPASTAEITLLARDLQVYTAVLTIQANLTGLRHYMVNWPIITAIIGIAIIFVFLSLITICSINRVVRNDSADTEVIFTGDFDSTEDESSSGHNGSDSLTGEGSSHQEEKPDEPDTTMADD